MPDEFEDYVEHPRFGRYPQYTDLNPGEGCFRLKEKSIPGTAVAADILKQNYTCVFYSHYFDVRRVCIDCGKPFIFYALEQKHWYEELGFNLSADCVRCPICRKKEQAVEKARRPSIRRYQELSHVTEKTAAETLEMAECCLHLIELGEFSMKQVPHVRELLNASAKLDANHSGLSELRARVQNLTVSNPVSSNDSHG